MNEKDKESFITYDKAPLTSPYEMISFPSGTRISYKDCNGTREGYIDASFPFLFRCHTNEGRTFTVPKSAFIDGTAEELLEIFNL